MLGLGIEPLGDQSYNSEGTTQMEMSLHGWCYTVNT